MFVQQLYTNCLAEAAYYIESDGEAAIVDPIREIESYIALANSRNAKIKYVFETHFHADFVSGHIDLAKKTGAKIIFGPQAETSYEVYNAKDGEEFKLGDLSIRALHTPGHTPESTCYLLLDASGKEYCVFTGDTLFVGDVGRPDLLDGKMTSEELAGMLFDSLNNKIKTLHDEVIVYPAHGAGSSCGKNIGKETWSTIGQQKQTNYALANIGKDDFITAVTEGLSAPPAYFFQDARINKEGYEPIDNVLNRNLKPLSPQAFAEAMKQGITVLDTRHQDHFEKGHIRNSINIGLNGTFAIWVGTLLDIKKPLILVCDPGKEEESITRLARVGCENIKGYLSGGIDAWKASGNPLESVQFIEANEVPGKFKSNANLLDIRRPAEVENGHVTNAIALPLANFSKDLSTLNPDETYYIYCATGYRSVIASSFLKSKGFNNIVNVHGGWNKIKDIGVPITTGAPEGVS
jgi:hydroxyacylglutathione hydrolase